MQINHQLVGNTESNKIQNNQAPLKRHSQKNLASAQNSLIHYSGNHRLNLKI